MKMHTLLMLFILAASGMIIGCAQPLTIQTPYGKYTHSEEGEITVIIEPAK